MPCRIDAGAPSIGSTVFLSEHALYPLILPGSDGDDVVGRLQPVDEAADAI